MSDQKSDRVVFSSREERVFRFDSRSKIAPQVGELFGQFGEVIFDFDWHLRAKIFEQGGVVNSGGGRRRYSIGICP